jgi:hypothetical protein
MWLCTRYGFYSIVQKSPGEFHVRARVRRDLENLQQAGDFLFTIIETPKADYRYRAVVGGNTVKVILQLLATTLDYSNFKSKIAQTPDQRPKLSAYHTVWETLYRVQEQGDAAG